MQTTSRLAPTFGRLCVVIGAGLCSAECRYGAAIIPACAGMT